MNSIPFLVTLSDKVDKPDEMGLFADTRSGAPVGLKEVPVDILKNNLTKLSTTIMDVLKDIHGVGKYNLTEVTLQAEVNAEGGVSLIGSANLGAKGTITLKFEKSG